MPFKKKKVTSVPESKMDLINEAFAKELAQGRNSKAVNRYVHKQKTKEELENNTKGMKSKIKITGIRNAILKTEGFSADDKEFVYGKTDKIMTAETEKERTSNLHGSLGREKNKNGELVFELSIAGSGFTEFRKVHHHSHGKHTFIGDPVSFDKRTILDKENEKKGYVSITEKEKQKIETLLTKLYGSQVDPTGKEMSKYIRKKVERGKTKVSLPGPERRDSADKQRSMDALRHYTLKFAQDYLREHFDNFEKGAEKPKPINLLLKGHSRGAVAIGEGMQMIQKWVHDNYKNYEHLVKYDLIQLDPVPGYGNHGVHAELDLNAENVKDGLGTAERANTAPKENVNSTVFYSMNVSEDFSHKHFFDPQAVKGAKRVVLCPMGHTLHLASVDSTQKAAGSEDVRLSKVGFTFAGNGEVYRGSGINQLEEGVFVMDENATMVKVKSPKQLEAIMNNALGEPAPSEKQRRQTLLDVAGNWFEAHPTPVKKRKEFALQEMNSFMNRLGEIGKIDSKDPAEREAAMKSPLYKTGEMALEGRMKLASLVTKDKLTDADRKLAGECISKMVLFEIASRSPNPEKITKGFEKMAAELAKTDEIKAFTNGCTPEDIHAFFVRKGEKAFCRNLQIQNNKLKKQKEVKPAKEPAKVGAKEAAAKSGKESAVKSAKDLVASGNKKLYKPVTQGASPKI